MTPMYEHREALERLGALTDAHASHRPADQPDLRDGSVYRCPPKLTTALRVALVTGRPLLLLGHPGSGKSSIAAYVARNLHWRYYEFVVTARTEARDLLYRFDLVRRLADAQVNRGAGLHDVDYVEPGPLWWAINPVSASQRGAGDDGDLGRRAHDPFVETNRGRRPHGAVLLIDELDKADPDVPGGLLVPLGSMRFQVAETGARVAPWTGHGPPQSRLVIITSNEERELPAAFVRRCIVHRLEMPDAEEMIRIAEAHLEGQRVRDDQWKRVRDLAHKVVDARPVDPAPDEHVPSVAEFLDAVHAMLDLGDLLSGADWDLLEELTITKPSRERP
jgi:MoxR-like ATPase